MADATYVTKTYEKQGGDEIVVASGGLLTVESGGSIAIQSGGLINDPSVVHNLRMRVAIADINSGLTLLAALPGFAYRLVDCLVMAIGGDAGAVTTVDILGTLSTSRKLVAFAQASLTRSAVLRAGGSGAAVLADGASFVSNDANTAITIGKTGSAVTTATHVDVILSYVIEAV